jgi:YVTN family beta-propeller protein
MGRLASHAAHKNGGVGREETMAFFRRRPGPLLLVGGALAVAWGVAAAGCARPGGGAGARVPVVYVSNARDDTVTRIDAATGRVIDPALPGGAAPWQLAVGTQGELLVLAATPDAGARLTHVTRGVGGWQARPVVLEPGAEAPLLAGAGRYAVVAYRVGRALPDRGPARCRVVPIDLATGRPGTGRDVCDGRDSVVALATGGDDAVPRAYLAVWRLPVVPESCGGATDSRVVALRLDTGARVAVAPLDGVPGPLATGPGGRLYAAEALPTAEVAVPGATSTACAAAGYDERFEGAPAWRVWALDATTLAPAGVSVVPAPVRALAATPDDGAAFTLVGRATVLLLSPGGGPATPFASLPEPAFGLAASAERLYTLDVFGDRVWGLDRRTGALATTIPTGHRPVGIVVAAVDHR